VNRPLSRPDVRHRGITSVDSGLRGPRRAGRYRGRVRWAAGQGRAAPRSPPGAGRDHPSPPAWGLLARAVDPSPRGASQAAPRGGAGQRQRMATLLPAHCGVCPSPDPPQPVQLRYQRPAAVLQVLQVDVAVERPAVDAAYPAAPVAGLRSAPTRVVGLRPAGASIGLVDPRSGLDAELPGPARLPAAHQASPPPLACARLRPTHQAGGHGHAGAAWRAHRTPRRWARRTRSGAGPRHPRRGDLCWIVSVGGCDSQAGRSAPAGRCARGEAQPLGILNWQLSF
jgi:hypothetical protein